MSGKYNQTISIGGTFSTLHPSTGRRTINKSDVEPQRKLECRKGHLGQQEEVETVSLFRRAQPRKGPAVSPVEVMWTVL